MAPRGNGLRHGLDPARSGTSRRLGGPYAELPPLDDDRIEARWAARADRQRLLRGRPDTAFGFVLEEHPFLRQTGGPEVTRELIGHVLGIAELRNVEVQAMPLVRKDHAGPHGPMQPLEAPGDRWFSYCEGQESGHFKARGSSSARRPGGPEA